MEAVMLAAGMGWRLRRGEEHPPKCLLRFDGESLLERHLRALAHAGVERLSLGVGFRAHDIHRELGRRSLPLAVDTVFNPHFQDGNIVTLHCLRHAMRRGSDILLMDADVLYHPSLITRLVQARDANCFLFDGDFEPGPEPVKICMRSAQVVEFSKSPDPGIECDREGESVGFFKLSASMAACLSDCAARWVQGGARTAFYEDALRELVLEHGHAFGIEDISGEPWIEIDFEEDVRRAEREVMPHIRAREAA